MSLPRRAAVLLIRLITERLLAPGGTFFFTNLAAGNPYRPLIEYFGDWFLLERSKRTCSTTAPPPAWRPRTSGSRVSQPG